MKHTHSFLFISMLLLAGLACNVSFDSTTPAVDTTKIALEFQATQMSLQLTQAALEAKQAA
ncbi:MAG: hypothetical protein DDG60_01845, partial [Anaerolineae bacterium]